MYQALFDGSMTMQEIIAYNLAQEAINRMNTWISLNDPDALLNLTSLNLKQLPTIPLNCKKLACSRNELTSLPQLPNCEVLICQNNKLTSLPQLPNCQILSCQNNKLTSLPQLPNCQILSCGANQLTYLPELPKCNSLYCSQNKLTYLPQLLESGRFEIIVNLNKYLHINKHLAIKYNIKETPNYNKCARIIQRNYKKYLRIKYQELVCNFLFVGPSRIVCLYSI